MSRKDKVKYGERGNKYDVCGTKYEVCVLSGVEGRVSESSVVESDVKS